MPRSFAASRRVRSSPLAVSSAIRVLRCVFRVETNWRDASRRTRSCDMHSLEQNRPPPWATLLRRGRKIVPHVSHGRSSGRGDFAGWPGACGAMPSNRRSAATVVLDTPSTRPISWSLAPSPVSSATRARRCSRAFWEKRILLDPLGGPGRRAGVCTRSSLRLGDDADLRAWAPSRRVDTVYYLDGWCGGDRYKRTASRRSSRQPVPIGALRRRCAGRSSSRMRRVAACERLPTCSKCRRRPYGRSFANSGQVARRRD